MVGVIWTWVSASNDAKEKQDETTLYLFIKERVAVNDLLNALKTTNLTQKERLKNNE